MACQYLNGLSPECVFIWRDRPAECVKALSHGVHLNGFSVECISICIFRLEFWAKNSHIYYIEMVPLSKIV